MSVQSLIRVLLDEADSIDELIDAVIEQRESIKSGDYAAMQDLMKRIQDIFFRVQAHEVQRGRLTESVGKAFQCKPQLSALSAAIPEIDRALFIGAGDRLSHSIFALKSEMAILGGLVEQNERYSAMLLSEWRRLDVGFMRSGGLDFRG